MGRVLVLLYHRVNQLDKDIHELAVTPIHFREQMEYLKKKFAVCKFCDDWSSYEEDSVVITFDDGYYDNYQYAFPILKEIGIPATIFVTTGTINKQQEFWWDELERILLDGVEFPDWFELRDELYSCRWDTSSKEKRKQLYFTIHWLMYSKVSPQIRDEWLKQIRNWRGLNTIGRNINYAVTPEACREMDESGYITIGAHTVNHPSLGFLKDEEQETEIIQSKEYLQKVLGHQVDTFSYPFGGKGDYNDTTIELCKGCQFKKVASNFVGIFDKQSDRYQIPRNIVRDWDIDTFKKQIESFWRTKL